MFPLVVVKANTIYENERFTKRSHNQSQS